MAYPVNKIADYVIEYAKNLGSCVNNLHLQKILYYLEARFLVEDRGSLFNDTIEKWQYGPVVPKVYYRFNHLGAEDIKHVPPAFDFMNLLLDAEGIKKSNEKVKRPENDWPFNEEDKEIIDDTINKLIKFKPFTLVDETHKHPSWLKDEKNILGGEKHIKYNRSEIKKDFECNQEFAIWRY